MLGMLNRPVLCDDLVPLRLQPSMPFCKVHIRRKSLSQLTQLV